MQSQSQSEQWRLGTGHEANTSGVEVTGSQALITAVQLMATAALWARFDQHNHMWLFSREKLSPSITCVERSLWDKLCDVQAAIFVLLSFFFLVSCCFIYPFATFSFDETEGTCFKLTCHGWWVVVMVKQMVEDSFIPQYISQFLTHFIICDE